MEYEATFVEAIQHVHDTVMTSDPQYWWPQILSLETKDNRPDGLGYFVYDLGKGEKGTGSGHKGDEHGHAYTAAMLSLINSNAPCALYAFPIENAFDKTGHWKQVGADIVVGFISGTKDALTVVPAMYKKRVYPMIGNSDNVAFVIPSDAKWALCASLNTEYRKAVSLYCQGVTPQLLETITPPLSTVDRISQ